MNVEDDTKRRLPCLTAPKVLDLTEPRDAQFVMASLISSATTRGEPSFAPGSAVDRFRTRREGDRNSMGWLQIGFDQTREGFMTVLADPENVRELGKAEVSGARSR